MKDTAIDQEMVQSMLQEMNSPKHYLNNVTVVGLHWGDKRLLRDMDPPVRYACDFFEDYEKAKIWLVK